MGLFDIFKGKSWEEENTFSGETPPCPQCGEPLRKKYVFSDMCCENMNCPNFYGLNDEDLDESESLSVRQTTNPGRWNEFCSPHQLGSIFV